MNTEYSNSIVLIVDDMPQNLEVLGNTLRQKGLQIAIATNGKQAITVAEKKIPDLILLDVAMPEMDGFMVCEKLKSNSKTKDIPVIFLTAKTETEDIIKGFEVGAVDYVTKPFKTSELLARVYTHLELKKSKDLILTQKNELTKLNASKDKFFSIISHDLRGPFTGFLGISKILNEQIDSLTKEEIKEFSYELNKSLNTQYQLLENLLEWSRIQTGNYDISILEIDLHDVAKNIIYLLKSNSDSKNIELVSKVSTHTFVKADQNMTQSVLQNLVANAIKFTNPGGTVEIGAEDLGQKIIITVKDNGIGIEPHNIEKLFKIDSHFSKKGTAQEKGTGLGLLLSKEMIDKLGGEIGVQSEVNKGTTFFFTLNKP